MFSSTQTTVNFLKLKKVGNFLLVTCMNLFSYEKTMCYLYGPAVWLPGRMPIIGSRERPYQGLEWDKESAPLIFLLLDIMGSSVQF